jgi:glutathione S-transferase
MSYTLIGSPTSPFVRRIRMFMENIPYEFKELNIYEAEDNLELNKLNPVNQIPVLLDGERKIWDSRVIYNYLNSIHIINHLDWDDENTLTAIDGGLSAGVALILLKRSGIDINEPYMIINRHKKRIESILDYLKPYIQGKGLHEWNFITMSIYSFLDWARFRQVFDFSPRPECIKFLETHSNRQVVQATAIPKV